MAQKVREELEKGGQDYLAAIPSTKHQSDRLFFFQILEVHTSLVFWSKGKL
jgi:hypothetical protein